MSNSKRKSWPASDFVSKSTIHLLESDRGAPPQLAWRRKLNSHANLLTEFNVTFREAMKMIKLGVRLWAYIQAERSQGRTAPIDPFSRQIRPSACHGVPLGGMGSGSIGRGFRGEFRRWQLVPGICDESPVLANQFSVFVSREGGKKYSSVLYPGRPPELGVVDNAGISSWDWNMSGQHSTYHAVFPRAWTIYEGEPDPDLKISCRQVSPFIPNNYRESCLPSAVFSYTLINTGKTNATVSLLFTWANSVGGSSHLSGGHFNESFKEEDGVSGVLLHHKTAKGRPPITFAIAAQNTNDINVSVCPCFSLLGKDGEVSATDMWTEMKEQGVFSEDHWDSFPMVMSPSGGSIAGAVAATVSLQPHEKKAVNFALVWDSPKVKFLKGRSYYRRYTKFYGFSGKAATQLAHDAILDFSKWEDAIEKWQEPILTNECLPEWYRFTLFNELYFLVAGGSIWTESETGKERGESLAGDRAAKYSSHDYSVNNDTTTVVQAETCPNVQTGEVENVEEDNADSTKNSRGSSENDESLVLSNGTIMEIQAEAPNVYTNESKIADQEDNANSREANSLNQIPEVLSMEAAVSTPHSSDICNSQNPSRFSDAGKCEDEQCDEKYDGDDVVCQRDSPSFSRVSSIAEEMQNEGVPGPSSTALRRLQAGEQGNSRVLEDHREDENVGRFLYLEGLEYVMWCTYDVHFYASFALLALFPKLELGIQQEFANATLLQNTEKTKFLTDADWGVRKVLGAVPHDLGMHDPWIEVNAYNIHDTSKWKDLNCKFVLQVYRDFVVTQDTDFAKKAWPAVFAAMAYMDKFDKDRDGLIENDGFPDQTYDTWIVHGVSAYCGGLWLAALQAAASMSEKLNHPENAKSFIAKFNQAKVSYEKKLWNGTYFNYDSGVSSNSNSIQADQLAGQMYTYASGLDPLFEEEKIRSTLGKIFEYNVLKVKNGKFGAVNGMHPDGKVDETCMQSREIWTGVTYMLAATMIHAGMVDEAFRTAEGIFHAGWSEEGFGYWFQTPESWTVNGHFRSLAYMRPLSIWAMQYALDSERATFNPPKDPSMERGCSFSTNMGFPSITGAIGKVQKPQMENLRTSLRCLHDCCMCKNC